MKYRIVKYSDNSFGVQKKILFWWFDECVEEDDMSFLLTFESIDSAEKYIDLVKSIYNNKKPEVIKEL